MYNTHQALLRVNALGYEHGLACGRVIETTLRRSRDAPEMTALTAAFELLPVPPRSLKVSEVEDMQVL